MIFSPISEPVNALSRHHKLHAALPLKHEHPSLHHHLAAKDEVTTTHRTGDRGARRLSNRASLFRPPACEAAAAVSATHRPDVAVRSRPQLARSVLLRIHLLPAGGRDGSYIPHAPTRK